MSARLYASGGTGPHAILRNRYFPELPHFSTPTTCRVVKLSQEGVEGQENLPDIPSSSPPASEIDQYCTYIKGQPLKQRWGLPPYAYPQRRLILIMVPGLSSSGCTNSFTSLLPSLLSLLFFSSTTPAILPLGISQWIFSFLRAQFPGLLYIRIGHSSRRCLSRFVSPTTDSQPPEQTCLYSVCQHRRPDSPRGPADATSPFPAHHPDLAASPSIAPLYRRTYFLVDSRRRSMISSFPV